MRVMDVYLSECSNKATGGTAATQSVRATAEGGYHRKAEQLMSDENCFKVWPPVFLPASVCFCSLFTDKCLLLVLVDICKEPRVRQPGRRAAGHGGGEL